MKLKDQVIDELMVLPGKPANLAARSTSDTSTAWLPRGLTRARDVAERDLEEYRQEIVSAQELLYASDTWAVLVIIQGLDASGKDGTIKHVMSGVNPQGCSVVSFKQPSTEELAHDFLWRCEKVLPERGHIGIFNRSYYEEVLIVRVHPELLRAESVPSAASSGGKIWSERMEDMNNFELHLSRNGTRVVKVFLHVSRDEQKRRFLQRLDDPTKRWKLSRADIAERAFFDDYRKAYEEALTATSTSWAPWYVVPADHKFAARALVGGVLAHAVGRLDLHYPEPSPEQVAELAAARQALLSEET